jgi:glycine hydroxymethyltransferase
MKSEHEKAINSAVFPGLQGGPLMHVIAAKAVAFREALDPGFRVYQQQVLDNAAALAQSLAQRGLRIVSGRTESHVMLVDLRAKRITGKEAERVLGLAHITCNKNATTRGFGVDEARQVGQLIADVLDAPTDEAVIARVRAQVGELTGRFPVYG